MPRKHGDFPSVRDAILYTASSLFTQKGVHGTSLGDIAAEAKLSKGTLYYYYSTKDELIVTITDDCLCHMTDILFSWVDGLNREEALRPALIRLFESLMADGHNARLYCVLSLRELHLHQHFQTYRRSSRLIPTHLLFPSLHTKARRTVL